MPLVHSNRTFLVIIWIGRFERIRQWWDLRRGQLCDESSKHPPSIPMHRIWCLRHSRALCHVRLTWDLSPCYAPTISWMFWLSILLVISVSILHLLLLLFITILELSGEKLSISCAVIGSSSLCSISWEYVGPCPDGSNICIAGVQWHWCIRGWEGFFLASLTLPMGLWGVSIGYKEFGASITTTPFSKWEYLKVILWNHCNSFIRLALLWIFIFLNPWSTVNLVLNFYFIC